jgi:DinB family protein
MTTDDLRYPIGREPAPSRLTSQTRRAAIGDIAELPRRLEASVTGLTDGQLDTPYRPDGWTVRQLVHHIADSHVNAYIRLKLALTEDVPRIAPYDERLWADLPDSRLPIDVSLQLIEAIHTRWTTLYTSLDEATFERAFRHPERGGAVTLDEQLQSYSWHSRHHVAHITGLRQREGWQNVR